jgi:hypothetical protein
MVRSEAGRATLRRVQRTRIASPRKTALVLVAVAVSVGAWIIVLKPPSKPEPNLSGVSATPKVTAPTSTNDEEALRIARTRWEDRRARIRAAHAPRARDDAPRSPAPSPRGCADDDCSPEAAENGGDAVFASFIKETTTLTQGCEELIGGKPQSVRITARLIGAPDIGTIVESLDVLGPVDHVDALTECLTEGMYTFELGDAATNFERDAVLMLGLLDEVAGEGWLSPEQVSEIRQQMIDGGLDPATDPMVAISENDTSSKP